jgi:hypothetical protein
MTAKKPTGPKPEVLKIEGDWKDAVGRALKRGKPAAVPPKKSGKKRAKR